MGSTAKGIRISNFTSGKKDKNGSRLKPESEWVYMSCPAIVSEELWDSCNTILQEQEAKLKKPGPKAAHLLSGYLYCSCGSKMYVYHRDKSPHYRCKPCNTKIMVEDMDSIYHEQLKTFLFSDTELDSYLSKSNDSVFEKEAQLQHIKSEIQKIRKRMDELVNLRLDGEMGKEAFAEQFQPLEKQRNQLDERFPELEAEIDFLKIESLSANTVLQEAKDLYTKWPTMPFEEKRSVVEVITDKITIDKQAVNISLSYPPHPSIFKKLEKVTTRNTTRSWCDRWHPLRYVFNFVHPQRC